MAEDIDVQGGRITFTTKELIARIDQKLDHVVEQMDAKASAQEVDDLRARVQKLENTVVYREGPIINGINEKFEDLDSWHQRQLGIIGAVVFLMPLVVAVLIHVWG